MPKWLDMPSHHPLNTALLASYLFHPGQLKAHNQCIHHSQCIHLRCHLRWGYPSITAHPGGYTAHPGGYLLAATFRATHLLGTTLPHQPPIHLPIHLRQHDPDSLYIMVPLPGVNHLSDQQLQQADPGLRPRHLRRRDTSGQYRGPRPNHPSRDGIVGVIMIQSPNNLKEEDLVARMKCMHIPKLDSVVSPN